MYTGSAYTVSDTSPSILTHPLEPRRDEFKTYQPATVQVTIVKPSKVDRMNHRMILPSIKLNDMAIIDV